MKKIFLMLFCLCPILFFGQTMKLNNNAVTIDANGNITSENILDDVSYGECYFNNNATATTFTATATPKKVSGITLVGDTFRFSMSDINKLQYLGTKTVKKLVIISISLTAASTAKLYTFYIAKNGVVQSKTKQQGQTLGLPGRMTIVIKGVIEFTAAGGGTYIELWVQADTDTTSCTVVDANLTIK